MNRLLCALLLVAFSAAPVLASPNSDVEAALMMLGSARSYHVSGTSHGQTADMDSVKPDKLHVVVSGLEFIKIGSVVYTKMGGAWQKFAVPGVAERVTGMFDGAIKNAIAHAQTLIVTDLGPKIVNGVPLHGYTIKDKDGTFNSTLYLDGKGAPARMETSESTVLIFSKINEPVTIEAPV